MTQAVIQSGRRGKPNRADIRDALERFDCGQAGCRGTYRAMKTVTIAAAQTVEFREDIEAALACVADVAARAEAEGASLLCFPEGFLQGYLTDEAAARRNSGPRVTWIRDRTEPLPEDRTDDRHGSDRSGRRAIV